MPVEAEDPDRVALVRAADEVELAVLEEQVVRVDLARVERVALQRVVVERDRLVAEDRRLDLGQVLRELAGAALAVMFRFRPSIVSSGLGRPQVICCRARRSGSAYGELAVEQPERGVQPRELVVVEGDRREVEVLRAQRVGLLLAAGVDRLVDRELDAERLELARSA
jgi:hypothetical protein